MEKKSLYIVIAIVIVAALIVSFGNLTGRGTIGECIDSDAGDNPYIPGSVSFSNSKAVYKDACFTLSEAGIKKFLEEKYCIDELDRKTYYCETGCLENEKGEGYCKEGEASIYNT